MQRAVWIARTPVLREAVCVQEEDVAFSHEHPLIDCVGVLESHHTGRLGPISDVTRRNDAKWRERDAKILVDVHEPVVTLRKDERRGKCRREELKPSIV